MRVATLQPSRQKQANLTLRGCRKEVALAITVFSKELFAVPVGGSEVDVYQLCIAGIGCFMLSRPRQQTGLVISAAATVLLTLLLYRQYNFAISATLMRQVGAVSFLLFGTGAYVLTCSRRRLLYAYYRVCYYAALLGLLQMVLSLIGLQVLIRLPLRLDSLAAEPSHYAVAIAPCVYYCVRNFQTSTRKNETYVILASLVLTVSATAVAVLVISVALAFFRRRGFLAIIAGMLAFPILINVPPDIFPHAIATRITDMREHVQSQDRPWESLNLTVVSFATNFDVMWSTIEQGHVFGNGFCGHSQAYHRHYDGTAFLDHHHYGINSIPAHCLLIRIVSEFGLPGLLLLVWTIGRFIMQHRSDVWSMFFVMALLSRGFKLGSWIDYGLPIFLLAPFYFRGRIAVTSKREMPRTPSTMRTVPRRSTRLNGVT